VIGAIRGGVKAVLHIVLSFRLALIRLSVSALEAFQCKLVDFKITPNAHCQDKDNDLVPVNPIDNPVVVEYD